MAACSSKLYAWGLVMVMMSSFDAKKAAWLQAAYNN